MITALYFAKTHPIEGTKQPYLRPTVSTTTFDSDGVKLDGEPKWIGEKKGGLLNQDEPYLTQLLKDEDQYICNSIAYQINSSKVNTYGSHVVHRLYNLKYGTMNCSN